MERPAARADDFGEVRPASPHIEAERRADAGMSLLLDERMLYAEGELLLSAGPLLVGCQLTIEWLRGVAEPTWYGYLVPLYQDIRILPGRYRLRLGSETLDLLVRRPASLGDDVCFPFWGLGSPPVALAAAPPAEG